MLYIDCVINDTKMKAFIDSGAQTTIMSKECAEKCNLLRLMDSKFSGIAYGVGTSKILGKIHLAPMKIGTQYYNCSFTILENSDIDILFGLDNLKKLRCKIDLELDSLIIGEHNIPFLSEKDLPKKKNSYNELQEKIDTIVKLGFSSEIAENTLLEKNGDLDEQIDKFKSKL